MRVFWFVENQDMDKRDNICDEGPTILHPGVESTEEGDPSCGKRTGVWLKKKFQFAGLFHCLDVPAFCFPLDIQRLPFRIIPRTLPNKDGIRRELVLKEPVIRRVMRDSLRTNLVHSTSLSTLRQVQTGAGESKRPKQDMVRVENKMTTEIGVLEAKLINSSLKNWNSFNPHEKLLRGKSPTSTTLARVRNYFSLLSLTFGPDRSCGLFPL